MAGKRGDEEEGLEGKWAEQMREEREVKGNKRKGGEREGRKGGEREKEEESGEGDTGEKEREEGRKCGRGMGSTGVPVRPSTTMGYSI